MNSHHKDTKHTQRHEVQLVAILHGVGLALLALHLYVRTLPPTPTAIPAPDSAEAAWWGFWPVTYLPDWAVWAGALAVLGTMATWWIAALRRQPAPARMSQPLRQPIEMMVLGALSLALVAAFFAFPIAHTRWGDAFMLAKGIAWPDPALRLTHSWQAPLDVFVHSQIWLALGERLGWEDAMPVYRWLSPLAGALFLGVTLLLARERRPAPGWLIYGLLTTLGLMQLFFGYVENYSFAAVGVLAFLWLGLRVLEGVSPLWLAALALALTNAIHPSTVVLAPALLYLGWRQWRGNQRAGRVVLEMALPMVLVGAATFAWMELSGHGIGALLNTDRPGGGDARWFVPLFETTTRWERYTMFSWLHLRDWLNGQMLVAPVILPALVVLGFGRWFLRGHTDPSRRVRTTAGHPPAELVEAGFDKLSRRMPSTGQTGFLAIASILYLAFTFVWNPDYGGQRDWDLFSLAALPATLLLAAVAAQVLTQRRWLLALLPLIVLQAWHTAAWIYQNTLPWAWPD